MQFEFATAGRILFGAGASADASAIVRELGTRALVVTGRDSRRAQPLRERLNGAGIGTAFFPIAHEPTLDDIERGVATARAAGCDVLVGFGGGSVIDAAKAISALLTNTAPLIEYLEVIGRAQPLSCRAAPCMAIPTTAGTGAEVTRNAVLAAPEHRVKVSLRSPLMLPRVAIVDPELTYDLPPELTATTGLDALTQLIEPYVSSRANPFTDPLCVDGLRRAGRSLRIAFEHGHVAAAREDMAWASLFGGLALANAGLGAVHGLAGPIGGAFPAPHGAVCASLLPEVTAMNLRALRARAPRHDSLRRYAEAARLVTGQPHASADDLVAWLRQLIGALGIRPLSAYGVTAAAIPDLVVAAGQASSMKANPLPLTPAECGEILSGALGG